MKVSNFTSTPQSNGNTTQTIKKSHLNESKSNLLPFGLVESVRGRREVKKIIDNTALTESIVAGALDSIGGAALANIINAQLTANMLKKIQRVRGVNEDAGANVPEAAGIEIVDHLAQDGLTSIIDQKSEGFQKVKAFVGPQAEKMVEECTGHTAKEFLGEAGKYIPVVGPATHAVVKNVMVKNIGWDEFEKLGGKRPNPNSNFTYSSTYFDS